MKWILAIVVGLLGSSVSQAAWDTPENGNPIVPGYFADPSILYDSASRAY